MRNALHRAVLRRVLLRSSVIGAFLLAFSALAAPSSWLGGAWLGGAWLGGAFLEEPLARGLLGACAVALLAGAQGLAVSRRGRPRVTAPRAATSGF
jgi:hypothetical protein